MRAFARLWIVLLLTASVACAHFRVAPQGMAPSTLEQKRRVHAIAWGALEPPIEPPNCNGNGMASVTVKITALDVLATIVTLGFVAPATVEWTCAKANGVVTR
jgi:hypothetical protein